MLQYVRLDYKKIKLIFVLDRISDERSCFNAPIVVVYRGMRVGALPLFVGINIRW